MKIFQSLCLTFVCFSLTACGGDTGGDTENTAYSFPHDASDMVPDPAVVYGTLENGLRYAIMENDTPTNTAALRVRFGTGSLNEADDEQGIAHFLEHMAFNGSKNIPEGEMTKRLERLGLAFGADTNAFTSFDQTVYTLALPNVSDELLDESLMIMRETAENLTLDPGAIDRERGIIDSEKRRRDSPGNRAQLHNLDFFFKGSRVPDRLPIGQSETIASMTAPQFRNFYEGYYRPDNTFIVLVGDIPADKAVAKITSAFDDWAAAGAARSETPAGASDLTPGEVGFFWDPEITTSISMAAVRPYTDEMDTSDNRRDSVLDNLGNSILNRRFSTLARGADAPFLSAGAGVSASFEVLELASLSVSTQPEKWKEGLAAAEQELRRALEFGFTQSELDEQLSNMKKNLEIGVQTAPTRRTGSLASSIMGSFAGERVFTHPSTGLDRHLEYADSITVDDIWERFKTQWEGIDDPVLYLSTNQNIENAETVIRQALSDSRAIAVTKNEDEVTADFAYTEFGAPGKVVSRKSIDEIDAISVQFENGVRLNIKQTDFTKDVISIRVGFGDGFLSLPKNNPNIRLLAGTVMNDGGLKAHSADELDRILAGKAVGASFGVGAQRFTLTGSTVPSDFTDQMNVMAAHLTAPGYRPEAEQRYETYIESIYPTLDSTPGGVVNRDVPRLIRSGDPRYGLPEMDAILAVSTDDVAQWLQPQLDTGMVEIGVVGDIDPETVIEQVARTFGALPKRKTERADYAAARKIRFPKGKTAPVVLRHAGEANRAALRTYWPAPDGTDLLRRRQLGVLRAVVQNRLTDVIREESATTYSPSAGSYSPETYPGYGFFSVSLDLDPKDITDMSSKIDEIAADIAAGNITEDEFIRATKPSLEGLDDLLESNSYWLGLIDEIGSDPTDLDAHTSMAPTYQNMTLADIKPYAKTIFRPETAYRVHVLPAE